MTITPGFAILVLSSFIPIRCFGLPTGLSMPVTLLADLALLARQPAGVQPTGNRHMKQHLNMPIAALLLLAGSTPSLAEDDIKILVCGFEHGQLKVEVNYTEETVNGVTAIIDDREIVWKAPGGKGGLAVINRYTGVMQMSLGGKQDTGKCTRLILKEPVAAGGETDQSP